MSKEDDLLRVALKKEMEIAHKVFIIMYKKMSIGLTKIYSEAMLSNELKEVRRLHTKFFGFIKKSKNAKEKWKDYILIKKIIRVD